MLIISGHKTHSRVMWICRILPLETYENICRKVFFATNAYTDVDLIIVNSFLSYMFAEHAVIYGDERSQSNCDLCRVSLGKLLRRLPLVLPASMEVVAALTFGVCIYNPPARSPSNCPVFTLCGTVQSYPIVGFHFIRPESLPNPWIPSASLNQQFQ